MTNKLVVISAIPNSNGWSPLTHMANLASKLFDARLIHVPTQYSRIKLITTLTIGRNRNPNKPNAIIIVPQYTDLHQICTIPGWRNAFNQVSAWVFDSFWTERVPNFPATRAIDHLFISSNADVEEYEKKSKVKTTYLPWGSDVLGLGGIIATPREVDLLRVGRQPNDWDVDLDNAQALQKLKLNYHARPPDLSHTGAPHRNLMTEYMIKAKFTLAHSNLIDNSRYTHPTKEYITARWTDSLACGCTVAGYPPKTDMAYQTLLWPGALLEFESGNRKAALPALAEACQSWTPLHAEYNYRMALERLDWRWRFKEIADQLKITSSKLSDALDKIKTEIKDYDNNHA